MTKEERQSYINSLKERLQKLSTLKTSFLETQSALVGEPEYNDDTMDEPFELVDCALEDAKRNLEDIIYQLENHED